MVTRSRPRSRDAVRRPLILVVDDFADGREMYCVYLRSLGFRVESAADGESAVAAAKRMRPSVILMDLSLPGLDGWEATRQLKTNDVTRGILVVALTGRVDVASRQRAMLVGCDLFVPKPCLPSDVAAHVVRLLDAAAKTAS
jgi:CheY-like chemotaxis protein